MTRSPLSLSITLAAIFVVCLTAGCNGKLVHGAQKGPTVEIDDWWNVDYAKGVCSHGGHEPCVIDPTEEVRDFELQMATTFQSDTACHGFRLVRFDGTNGSNSPSKPQEEIDAQWTVMLDYIPDQKIQSWSMVSSKPLKVVASGTADAKEMVHTFCSVLSGKGGSVVGD